VLDIHYRDHKQIQFAETRLKVEATALEGGINNNKTGVSDIHSIVWPIICCSVSQPVVRVPPGVRGRFRRGTMWDTKNQTWVLASCIE
jgi:hypothetical protein